MVRGPLTKEEIERIKAARAMRDLQQEREKLSQEKINKKQAIYICTPEMSASIKVETFNQIIQKISNMKDPINKFELLEYLISIKNLIKKNGSESADDIRIIDEMYEKIKSAAGVRESVESGTVFTCETGPVSVNTEQWQHEAIKPEDVTVKITETTEAKPAKKSGTRSGSGTGTGSKTRSGSRKPKAVVTESVEAERMMEPENKTEVKTKGSGTRSGKPRKKIN